jgi:acyl-CoA thioester hydrolase
MHQQIWRDGLVLAEARLRFGFIGPNGRPCRLPEAWRIAFAPLIANQRPE